MNVLLIIVCLIGFIYGLRQRNKINPFSLFFGIWLIISIAASLKLYGLLEAGDFTYTVMLVGSVIFFVGLLFGEKIFSRRKMKLSKKKVEYELNYKLMYVLAAVTILVYVFYLGQTAIQLLNGHDLGYIRQMAQHGEMYDVPIMNMLRILIAFPFTYVIALVTPTDIFFGKKDKILIVLTVVIMILRILSDGSRSAVVWLLVSAIICFLYKRKNVDGAAKKINKKLLATLFIVPIAVLAIATLSRSGTESARFTYYYFAMEPKMLENWMGIADQSGILGFGLAAFNGFFFVLFYIITHVFTFLTAPAGYQAVYDLLEGVGTNWQTIAEQGTRANSYASTFFTFYVDGRLIGVIIGMLLFGLAAGYFYRKVKVEKTNLLGVSLYNFIMMGIFFSFIQFPLKSPFNAVALVMLLTIAYKKKKVDGELRNSEGDTKSKLKILAVSHSAKMSGANKSFLDILIGLKKDYDITVLVNAKAGELVDALNIENIKNVCSPYSWSYMHPRKNIVKRFVRFGIDFLGYTREFGSDKLDFIMEGQDFDLIYTNTSVVDVGAKLSRRYGVPHVWHIREFGEEDFGLVPIRTKRFRKKLLREAKSVIVISKALEKKYNGMSDNIKVVYNGFQVNKLSGESLGSKKNGVYTKDDEVVIIVVGQVTPAKGQKIAVEAVRKLVDSGWKIKLVLAGNVDQNYIKTILDGINERPKWLEIVGEVSNVDDLRRNADIELVCSRNEAFGRVTIEAMLHRLLVIGANSGGTAELISDGKTGFLFKVGDADDLARKILEALGDDTGRHKMIKSAHSFAEGFTIDKTIRGVRGVMDYAISGR